MKMTDSTHSNSEMLGLNDNPKINEMGCRSHNNNPENSFDEVFSLLESTLIDLKENDNTIGLHSTDIDIDLNNPVGMCELGITKEVLSSDTSSNKEIGLGCKFSAIDKSSIKHSVEMVDYCTDNLNVCQCRSTQNEKGGNITCSCKVCSDNSLKYCSLILPATSEARVMEGDNESKNIQMSTIIELKHKVTKPVFCNCLKVCNCSSSVVVQHFGLAEDKIDTKDEINQNNPICLKFDANRPTCIEDATRYNIVTKEAAPKTSDILLEAENCSCDTNNLVTSEIKSSPEQKNIEINTQLNEAIDEIVNEDELLANDEENLNINVVSLDCITMENNVSLEEELLLDDKEPEIVLNENICVEKMNHIITENFIEDTSMKITMPTEEIKMPLDKEKKLIFTSNDMNLQDISTVSVKLEEDNELKSESNQDIPKVSKEFKTTIDQLNTTNDLENEIPTKLFCSTPVVDYKLSCKTLTDRVQNRNFGSISLLGINSVSATEETVDLKRKVGSLMPIKEEDEEIDSAKRMKMEENNLNLEVSRKNLSRKTLEAPAVSLLKKWRPSCLSRNSYYVIDESGNEDEDDYEDAIKSLSETLMKESEMNGSTAHEEYQKYVLAENSLDNLKFTEIMQEMTQEMQDQFNDEDRFFEDINEVTVIENTIVETKNEVIPAASKENSTFQLELKENLNQSKSYQILVERKDSEKNVNELSSKLSESLETDNNLSIIYSNDQDKNNDDEEDMLLKEGEFDDKLKTKRSDLEFFISNDPMENADNTNKEWDLLRKLSTDEERYKAVRERWRSLTIPDPKKDLTFRQWRVRNNLPPLSKIKTNTQKRQKVNEPATRLCTALFDQNIEQIIGHLQFKRQEVRRDLERELECLAFQQKHQQEELFINCASQNQIYNLHCCHIKEVHAVKQRYENEFVNEERISRERIDALKTASEEVLAFEKYYQGLDEDKPFRNRNSILLTDTEIEELIETECMLEQYDRYYDGR